MLLIVLLTAPFRVRAQEAAPGSLPEKVRVQLKWRHQFQFAGYYAALEKGFFRDAGLQVELVEGQPGIDASAELHSRRVQYAIMSPAVLIERQQGKPFVVLGAVFQHSAIVILTRKDAGLNTPQDLLGRRIMFTPEVDAEIHAMLVNEGVPLNALEVLSPSWSIDDLIEGRTDALSAYLTNEPFLMRQRGIPSSLLRPVSYGIDFYGDCLVTTEHEIEEHPERTEKFFRAVQQGWVYALEHPEEIARLILAEYSSGKTLEQLLYEARTMRELIGPELIEIGYMNPDRWRRIADIYAKLGMISPEYDLRGFLYADFKDLLTTERQLLVRRAFIALGAAVLAGLFFAAGLLLFNKRLTQQVHRRTAELEASEQHFRSFFDLASVGVAQVDVRTGRFLKINRKYCDILGYSEEEMLNLTLSDITHPDDVNLDRQQLRHLVSGASTEFTIEKRYLHRHGRIVWVILSVSPMWGPGEEPSRSLAVIRDITSRKQAEEELVFAANVFEHSIEGIVVTDADGVILRVNRAFSKITGYSAEEAIGQNPRILKSNKHPEAFYRQMWQRLSEEGQWSGEIWNRRKNGEVYPEWLTINAVRNPQGHITNYVSIFHDITELKQQQEALEHQAQHDALTGLPNRVLLNDRLEMALRRIQRNSGEVALMFLDLDNFKKVNDGFGHTAGDELLVELSGRIKAQLRNGDTLARQGGDEFLILLPDMESTDTVILVANRLLDTLRQPFYHRNIEFFVTGSIGITIAPEDGTSADVLVKNADMAMYRAKSLGRNNYQFFTAELDSQAQRRISLEAKLRRAIEMNEFELYYQPLVNSRTGVISGAEALVRWRHEGEVIAPMEFIPLAEESGLILPLGEWVMRTAAAQARKWQDAGHGIRLSINISSRQFEGQDLAGLFREVLASVGLEPGTIYFEITESMLMSNLEKARRILGTLQKEGVKFYLDDFGTGYSSLSYLKKLPLDGLKIDRSFIRDIVTDTDSRAIAAAIVSLAKTLHLDIVAEGVENNRHLEILNDMDAMLVQGYLASPPVPVEAFNTLLHRPTGLLPGNTG